MSRRGRTCECGSPKRIGAEACDRCSSLDGTNVPEQELIDALRNLGGDATVEAIQVEAGWSYRHTRRVAQRLEATGRVLRIETGEERHRNQPVLILDSARERRRWAQMHLPRLGAWLEPSREAAGCRRILNVRRAVRRQRAQQMGFKFRRARGTAPTERAAA